VNHQSRTLQRPTSPQPTTTSPSAQKVPSSPKETAPPFDPEVQRLVEVLAATPLDTWGRASATALTGLALRGEWVSEGHQTLAKNVHKWAFDDRDRLERTISWVIRRTPFRGVPKQLAGQVIQLMACGWATR